MMEGYSAWIDLQKYAIPVWRKKKLISSFLLIQKVIEINWKFSLTQIRQRMKSFLLVMILAAEAAALIKGRIDLKEKNTQFQRKRKNKELRSNNMSKWMLMKTIDMTIQCQFHLNRKPPINLASSAMKQISFEVSSATICNERLD